MVKEDVLPQWEAQEEELKLLDKSRQASIGLLKDEIPGAGIVMLSPLKMKHLRDEGIYTWVERHFGAHAGYSDLDYADAGGDILEHALSVIQAADIVVKLEPLTLEEASVLKPNQIVVSTLDNTKLSPDYFRLLKEKSITAFDIDTIEDVDGNSIVYDIFYREESPAAITLALSNFILPLLYTLANSGNIRATIQTNPALFQSVYCFNGDITNKEIAHQLGFPWRDFTSLFWSLN